MPHVSEFTIGWICALSQELVAAQEFLDEEYESREVGDCPSDNNSYSFGSINGHKIVIAVLPQNQYGHVNAAVVARDMSRSFSNLRFGLMVGVGGGAPSAANQIRLGDVVVSSIQSTHGAVFQYDFGKTIQEKKFTPTGYLNQPPQVLQIAVASLCAKHTRHGNDIHEAVQNVIARNKRLQKNYSRPDVDTDRLFLSGFVHTADGTCCSVATSQRHPRLVPRDARSLREDDVVIHYGLIASANQVLKDAVIRDRLATEKNVLCFEMEAAGLMNHFPCLVIRGICDYSDTHKNKAWQGYAAMTAAAYAKNLLELMVPQQVVTEKKLGDVLEESLQSCQSLDEVE
ncbi:hypothetical protein PFICI_01739 [Pestalotiopsis fici W106-1]|uniref:Uncharacterized protein n=1 Tax=Pestalotiopsis fici (strain W106-1 / CGMCC3.15140) TaxID=1229662 RepID=W3XRQ5_PESFW|nr:uncharacterized protein PFICI_01739 [Pestalotiopsis fici W106-1]ETS87911.1 hypothetical protein PFICI_01739 [Pestalotiopsis fici W106-1]